MKTQRVLYWMVFTAILAGLCLTTGCPAANTTTPAAPANPPQVQGAAVRATGICGRGHHRSCVGCPLHSPGAGHDATLDLGTCNQIKTDLLKIQTGVNQIVVEANKVQALRTWAQRAREYSSHWSQYGHHYVCREPNTAGRSGWLSGAGTTNHGVQ